jgi:hypothetical protein
VQEEIVMDSSDVKELYYITPIANVPSIMMRGILSHNLSMNVPHQSIAMQEIQDKRSEKVITGTNKKLHDYANLYFDAHNPMLSKIRHINDTICILVISTSVLELTDVIISDRNAASKWSRFYGVSDGLAALDKKKIYDKYWTNARDPYEAWELKSKKCAEVLIPDKIEPKYILEAYVVNQAALDTFNQLQIRLNICIKSDIFF